MVDSKLDTERLILDAARKVFIQKGLDGARMQEIADEAGINKALLHYYFRSKEKLFRMVFIEAMAKFFPTMIGVLASKDITIEKKIEQFVHHYISVIKDNPFIPAFIINELNKNPDQLTEFFVNSGIDLRKVTAIIKDVIAVEIGITEEQARHFVVNIISLCVFPFVGRPLLERIIFQSDSRKFNRFINEREKTIVDLLIKSIPKK
jgi:AcrR family transcriptional regulator